MQTRKRVYPSERKPAKWVSYSLLFLSAVILFSGVAARSGGDAVFEIVATPSPIPLDAAFDETRETREITLNGSVWYALQLGAFETEEAAGQLAEQFQRRGAAGYLWPEERFRVLAAVYPEKEDAQAVRQQLRDQHDVDSYLFEISIPSVSLRMTGMRGADRHSGGGVPSCGRADPSDGAHQRNPRPAGNHSGRGGGGTQHPPGTGGTGSASNGAAVPVAEKRRRYGADWFDARLRRFCPEKTGQESNALLSRRLKYQTIQTIRLLLELTDELRNT